MKVILAHNMHTDHSVIDVSSLECFNSTFKAVLANCASLLAYKGKKMLLPFTSLLLPPLTRSVTGKGFYSYEMNCSNLIQVYHLCSLCMNWWIKLVLLITLHVLKMIQKKRCWLLMSRASHWHLLKQPGFLQTSANRLTNSKEWLYSHMHQV